MVTYDPRGQTWDSWCALTAEQFAAQDLGVVIEDHWRDWGNAMAGIGYFANSNVPLTNTFESWQDWATSLVGIMSIQP